MYIGNNDNLIYYIKELYSTLIKIRLYTDEAKCRRWDDRPLRPLYPGGTMGEIKDYSI